MRSLETFLPVIILIWGIFSPSSAIVRDLNDMRDKILDAGSSYTVEHRTLIYGDWKGFFWSSNGYQVFLTSLVLLLILKFFSHPEEILLGSICIALAAMSIGRLGRHIKSFWFVDRLAIEKNLGSDSTQH